MKYYLGLDNGGTTTKAAIFDINGREVGVASTETAVILPKPGYVERDMEEMWQANCKVVREVLQKTGVDKKDVSAVAVCGHGKGLYLWGKDGKAPRNGIISTDNRAYAYPMQWKQDGTAKCVFELSAQDILACQPVVLLAWIRDNEPAVYENIEWVFECKDYVRFRLTGEARAEYTDYSGANLLNLHTRDYDEALLALFGIEKIRPALPPLCLATELCGRITDEAAKLTGLLPGTPVAGGAFDIDACALAVNVVDERNICMIAGTWSINEYPSPRPITDGKALMNSLFAIPEYYLVEECSPTSAANNEWFANTLLPELSLELKKDGKKVYEKINEWVEAIPPEEFCPVFLPFLLASNVHPNAKGSFVGMSASHTRAHLCRSVYEGIVFSHKYHLDKLLATRTQAPQCIRLAGGVTNSDVWVQMFADVMQLPIETVDVKETGASGCAIIGAVAAGDYTTLADAAAAMVRIKKRVEPNAAKAAIYGKKYALYLKAIDCLDGLWQDMQKLIENEI